MDAMLDHGAALRLAPTDLFTIAARGSDDRTRLAPLNATMPDDHDHGQRRRT